MAAICHVVGTAVSIVVGLYDLIFIRKQCKSKGKEGGVSQLLILHLEITFVEPNYSRSSR